MNVLIVCAHPEPKSFNGALRDLAVSALRAQDHRVQVSDLYEMDFDPIGGRHDFTVLENPDRISGSGWLSSHREYLDCRACQRARSCVAGDLSPKRTDNGYA